MPARTDTQPVAATVGRNIRRLRELRGIGQTILEVKTISYGYRVRAAAIRAMERGVNENGTAKTVTVDELVALARALGTRPERLLREPECAECLDAPPAGFVCSACRASTLPARSASAGGTQTRPETGHNRP